MTLVLFATIPLMIAAIAVAVLPLLVAMRHERELHAAEVARGTASAPPAEYVPVAA